MSLKFEATVWTWIYLIIISLLTFCGAGLSITYGTYNLQNKSVFSGLCGLFSAFTGIALIILVIIWSVSALLFRQQGSKYSVLIDEEFCPSEKHDVNNNGVKDPKSAQAPGSQIPDNAVWAKEKTRELVKIKRTMMKLRFVILFSLLFAFLCEVCSTGIFWFTYTKACNMFTVKENCFCSTSSEYRNHNHMLRSNCPFQSDQIPNILYCLSVYEPEEIQHERTTTFTLQCQKLSGEAEAEPLCTEYHTFIIWFKIMRIFLPLLAVIKIPMIVINFIVALFNWSPQKPESQSFGNATWLHLESLVNDKIDPIKYYENICASVKSVPPVGERLGPYGQEKEEEMFMSIRAGVRRGTNQTIKSNQLQITKPSQVEFSMAPTQLLTLNKLGKYSPPDKENNTFSTPLVSKKHIDSPNFNLSKMSMLSNPKSGPASENIYSTGMGYTERIRIRGASSVGSINTVGRELKFSTFRKPSIKTRCESSIELRANDPKKVVLTTPEIRLHAPASCPDVNNNVPGDYGKLEKHPVLGSLRKSDPSMTKPPTSPKPLLSFGKRNQLQPFTYSVSQTGVPTQSSINSQGISKQDGHNRPNSGHIQPAGRQGGHIQPASRQGSHIQPSSRQSGYIQPSSRQGSYLQQTSRQGGHIQPTNGQSSHNKQSSKQVGQIPPVNHIYDVPYFVKQRPENPVVAKHRTEKICGFNNNNNVVVYRRNFEAQESVMSASELSYSAYGISTEYEEPI